MVCSPRAPSPKWFKVNYLEQRINRKMALAAGFVRSGCSNKAPQTEGLNNRNCPSVLGARNPKARCWQGWFPPRALRKDLPQAILLGLETAVSCVPSHHLPFVCLCPNFPFLQGRQSCWIKAHPQDLTLPHPPLLRPYLQIQSHPEVGGC